MTEPFNYFQKLPFSEAIAKYREELETDPNYRLEREMKALERERQINFKLANPLHIILEDDPCNECIITAKCKKSQYDGSACIKYKRALRKYFKKRGKKNGRDSR